MNVTSCIQVCQKSSFIILSSYGAVDTASEEFKNGTITGDFEFMFDENSVREIPLL